MPTASIIKDFYVRDNEAFEKLKQDLDRCTSGYVSNVKSDSLQKS